MKRPDLEVTPSGDPPPESDQALVSAYLAGSTEATTVLDGWIDAALRASFMSVRGEWEDLRQEIRIRVFNNLRHGRFHGDSLLRTYVHGIARHVALDLCRSEARQRRGRAQVGLQASLTAPAAQERLITRDLLEKILCGLPQEDRHLLKLVYGQHLPYTEVSRLLRMPVATVKTRMFRCRQRLLDERRRLGGSRDA